MLLTKETIKKIKNDCYDEVCDSGELDHDVGFEFLGTHIIYPWASTCLRFDYTDAEAVKEYGFENVFNFVYDYATKILSLKFEEHGNGITLETVKKFANQQLLHGTAEVSFGFDEYCIVHPWLSLDRKELTDAEAVEEYGFINLFNFVHEYLKIQNQNIRG